MKPLKDSPRSIVRIGFDGRVQKTFRGADAEQRFDTEVRILKLLEQRGCDFVPRVLHADREALYLETTNCGSRVEHLSERRLKELFEELEGFGVRHDDPFLRNVTYRGSDGRFCIIDFELATEIGPGSASAPAPQL